MHIHNLPFSKIRNVVLGIALVILVGGVGYRLGERRVRVTIAPNQKIVINQQQPDTVTVDFSLFWDVWQKLNRYYIDQSALDVQKMVYGAISGMVAAIDDPYTTFLPPKENEEFKEDLGGSFEGIGAQLGLKDGQVIVIAPLDGMPAQRAGVRAGDYILKVDGAPTSGWSVTQAVNVIRGEKGTTVVLQILHDGESAPVDVSIVRGTIIVPSVETWVQNIGSIKEISGVTTEALRAANGKKVAYLKLSRFGDRTYEEWLDAVEQIVKAKNANGSIVGLILDLRNNPGGYLDGSVFVASEFLKSGTVVSQENSDGSEDVYEVNRDGSLLDIPVIVLVNQGSASASEIVAGALRDYKRATLVGQQSYGKGSVQTPFELAQGAGVHITTGKWILPSGTWINKIGVTPDVEVALESTEASMDAQLAKAIELLVQ